MAIIGPRPLLVRYLDRYNEEQRHRHDVRPGLTGYAQAHGRNAVSWEDKFAMDVWYTTHITLVEDIKIIIDNEHNRLEIQNIEKYIRDNNYQILRCNSMVKYGIQTILINDYDEIKIPLLIIDELSYLKMDKERY